MKVLFFVITLPVWFHIKCLIISQTTKSIYFEWKKEAVDKMTWKNFFYSIPANVQCKRCYLRFISKDYCAHILSYFTIWFELEFMAWLSNHKKNILKSQLKQWQMIKIEKNGIEFERFNIDQELIVNKRYFRCVCVVV